MSASTAAHDMDPGRRAYDRPNERGTNEQSDVNDLFEAVGAWQRLELPEAEIYYLPALELQLSPREILARLIEHVPWRSEEITVYGKRYVQPRLTAWYGDPGARYSYSGISLEPLPWTELLAEVRESVEQAAGTSFNSVLLNYYRDHHDRMGLHSDDEPELGRNPIIASLSLGAERTFVLRHKKRRDLGPYRLRLSSGSLLLMKGETQHRWKHGIDKEPRTCGPRVNLTFRRIVPVEPAKSAAPTERARATESVAPTERAGGNRPLR